MKWPPTNCWTAPKTIEGNRHYQVKAYGGKNDKRWVDLFPTKNKKDIKRISWLTL
ncbi:TIGR02450 family Trp-rich protein, partial [uncultured Prochlorococcus sp.]